MISIYKMAIISVISLVGAVSTYLSLKLKKDTPVQDVAEKIASVTSTVLDRPFVKKDSNKHDDKAD